MPKIIRGITRSILDSILSAYVTAISLAATLASYVTASSLSTTLSNYATQVWVNSQIALGISSFLTAFAQKDNVQYYTIAKTATEPSGAGTENDLKIYAPAVGDPEIWKYTTSWAKFADLAANDRILNNADHKIYTWDGEELTSYTMQNNDFVPVDDGPVLRFNGSALVEFPIVQAGQLSADELAAIQGANNPAADNVLATMDDIPGSQLTSDELAGIQNSSMALSATNPVSSVRQNWIQYHKDAKVIAGAAIFPASYREVFPHQMASFQDPSALNDEFEYIIYADAARTTSLRIWYDKYTNHGIVSWTLNGSAIGSQDLYSSSYTTHNLQTISSVSLVTGKNTLRGKVASKNASATGYFATIYGIVFGE